MVLDMAERRGGGSSDAQAVGEREGARRAAPFASAGSALEALVADLDRLGFDPVVAEGDAYGRVAEGDAYGRVAEGDAYGRVAEGDGATAVVAFANCPFADYAATHPDLVCSLHRGLVSGFVEAMGDATVVEFCPLAHRTPCQVVLA
jgi:hypothetical protein